MSEYRETQKGNLGPCKHVESWRCRETTEERKGKEQKCECGRQELYLKAMCALVADFSTRPLMVWRW